MNIWQRIPAVRGVPFHLWALSIAVSANYMVVTDIVFASVEVGLLATMIWWASLGLVVATIWILTRALGKATSRGSFLRWAGWWAFFHMPALVALGLLPVLFLGIQPGAEFIARFPQWGFTLLMTLTWFLAAPLVIHATRCALHTEGFLIEQTFDQFRSNWPRNGALMALLYAAPTLQADMLLHQLDASMPQVGRAILLSAVSLGYLAGYVLPVIVAIRVCTEFEQLPDIPSPEN